MALDFSLSEEHLAVRDSVRRLCRDEVAPLVNDAEENETFPRELFRLWGRLGLIGARYPADDGGAGLDKVAECIIREEMSAVCQGFASSWSAHSHLGIWPIWKAGTPAQKLRCFVPALAGEKIAGFGLSEPDGGSNVRALKTRATRVSGGWRLNGSKLYITNGVHADLLFVAARTDNSADSNAKGSRGISIFAVERNNEIETFVGNFGKWMGWI
jgi:alkylation response protein AidB-like acyl-CoA dehydrogenase